MHPHWAVFPAYDEEGNLAKHRPSDKSDKWAWTLRPDGTRWSDDDRIRISTSLRRCERVVATMTTTTTTSIKAKVPLGFFSLFGGGGGRERSQAPLPSTRRQPLHEEEHLPLGLQGEDDGDRVGSDIELSPVNHRHSHIMSLSHGHLHSAHPNMSPSLNHNLNNNLNTSPSTSLHDLSDSTTAT